MRTFPFCLLAFVVLSLSACAPVGPPPAFYDYSGPPPAGRHGDLIRYKALPNAPVGSRAYRVLYKTTAEDGTVIPVSGMVVIPNTAAPAGGRPVVAWAHPTTGVIPECAPSISTLRYLMIPGLDAMLKAGYAVAATDYPGLGAGTVHPFLDGVSEARAVLDSVRAIGAIPGAATNDRFALWGHSQGGQAVMFAAQLASSYTPELKLAGAAAAAPATDLAQLFRDDLGTTGGNNLAAMTLWSWSRVYGASFSNVVVPSAVPAIDTIAAHCLDTVFSSAAKKKADVSLSQAYFTVPDITRVEPWKSIILRNTPGVLPRSVPLFLSQSTTDEVVRPSVTFAFARKQCEAGRAVDLDVIAGVTHEWTAIKTADAAFRWIQDRMNGVPPLSDCERLPSIEADPAKA